MTYTLIIKEFLRKISKECNELKKEVCNDIIMFPIGTFNLKCP